MKLVNTRNKCVLAGNLKEAKTFLEKARGLLGKKSLPAGQGLLIRNCSSIHMFFMRFPIDVIYVDEALKVLKIVRYLRPWRISSALGAHSVIELPRGAVKDDNVVPDDVLCIEK